MKTKPLKALEPGFKKSNNNLKPFMIVALLIWSSTMITLAHYYHYLKKENIQKDATIARQQLIIDTLKDNQKEADWYQARFERDQEDGQ